ncbi:hypothetical protein C8Q80DRAFT_323656 [Daedaleopsis nitida]|nr:hypothetical protein C8Q80DRAFT_323656 [Daedaleopsis nitida]
MTHGLGGPLIDRRHTVFVSATMPSIAHFHLSTTTSSTIRSRTMPRRAVPIEVTEHAIDYLWDDHYALRQCALTCSSWVLRSRVHLFKTVEITTLRQLDSLRRSSLPHLFVGALSRSSSCTALTPRFQTGPCHLQWEYRPSNLLTSAPVVFLSGAFTRCPRAISALRARPHCDSARLRERLS